MLPENIFDELLGSFSFSNPADGRGYASYEAVPQSGAMDEENTFVEPTLRIWYRADTKISFERFEERLASELSHAGHKSDKDVLGPIIAFHTAHPSCKKNPTATLNRMLSKIVDADLSQFFVFPHPPPEGFKTFEVGHFVVGELDAKKLGYRSERAGSDYFARYGDRLRGRFAIERAPMQAKVLNLASLQPEYEVDRSFGTPPELWNRCLECYFQALSGAYYEDFLGTLMTDQELVIACGASYMDEKHIRRMPSVERVSVFLNIGGSWGFVAPGAMRALIVDLAAVDKKIPAALERLNQEFRMQPGAADAPPLRSYAHFVAKAKRYMDEGLSDEAFVHYVIALELLFGERSRTSESISRRVATVVFRPLSLSVSQAEQKIGKLYDIRSRYVHSGVLIGSGPLAEVNEVCEQVLWAILRCLSCRGPSDDMLTKWALDLDYLYTAFAAGKVPTDEDLRLCGICS